MTEGKDPEGRRLSSQAAGKGGWSTFRFFSGIYIYIFFVVVVVVVRFGK